MQTNAEKRDKKGLRQKRRWILLKSFVFSQLFCKKFSAWIFFWFLNSTFYERRKMQLNKKMR
jgi:hypothetical protein